ncbi:MAG: ATP-binding protein, partial [Planctomycetota bacterium]
MQSAATKSASRNDIFTLDDFAQVVPPKVTPVYKLCGVYNRPEFPITKSTIKVSNQKWRLALRRFVSAVKGNSVVAVGLNGQEELLIELLAQSQVEPNLNIRRLIFFDSESLANYPNILEVSEPTTKIFSINATPGQLVDSALSAERARYKTQSYLEFDDEIEKDLHEVFLRGGQLFTDVSIAIANCCESSEHNRITDELFSPSFQRWSCFKFDYDLPRDVSTALATQISDSDLESSAFTLIGGSGSGKTTILKRIAFDLEQSGFPVLWARPWSSDNRFASLKRFFKQISKPLKKLNKPIVVFVDDPFSFEMLNPTEIADSAARAKVNIKLVVSARRIEAQLHRQSDLVGELSLDGAFELADQLSEKEWSCLPEFLCKLKIAQDQDEANLKCNACETRSSRDTLGTLYWLLPEIRRSIKGALKQQYFKLGDYTGIKSAIIGGFETSAELLSKAWAFTAVSEKYRAPLPLEILVSALGVNFDAWISASKDGGNLAGVLYETDDDIEGTVCFRTRNWVVTEAIVEAINGGTWGTAGEYTLLQQIVEACRGGGTSIYHDFLVQLLVPRTKIEHLGPTEGLALYDSALECHAADDKLLEHHRGLWIKDKLDDPVLAEQAFTRALRASNFPYQSGKSGESDRYISTSLASNVLRKMDKGLVDYDTGKRELFEHLERARALEACDPKIAHVQCKLVTRLIKSHKSELDNDLTVLVTRAISDVDRAIFLQSLGGSQKGDLGLLKDVRNEIQNEISDVESSKKLAQELWNSNYSQVGFVLCARSMLKNALNKGKGSALNRVDAYCLACLGAVDNSEFDISPELAEVALHNLAFWLFPGIGITRAKIDWKSLWRPSI